MKVSGPRTSLRMAAALALAALAPLASAGDKYVVKAGTVITLAGEPIKDGVIVVEGGKITAVGKADEVKVPWDAEVLDKPELTAFPGFVEAHTSSGMDRANENIDVAPFLNIRDSIDPVGFYFEDSLRWGVLTMNVQQGAACVIGGQGMTVRPYGMTVEEMLVRPNSGLKMSARPKNGKSRATQARALRNAFADLRRHLEELVQEKKDGDDRARREALYQGRDLEGERGKGRAMSGEAWKVEGLERVPRGEIDEKLEPLLDVVEGRLPVWFHCGSAMDVRTAIDIATTNGFLKQTRLVLDPPCWKAADAIAEAGVPVVLNDGVMHTERDPVTGEEKETFVPKVYADKGITFALSSDNQSTRSLWFQVAQCIANGMSRADALAAATTVPAKMIGVDRLVGSFEVGKAGNIALYSGDPLSVSSFVEYVVLGGKTVYDRSEDARAQHLVEGVQPANTGPLGHEDEEVEHPHEGEFPDEEEEKAPVDRGEEKSDDKKSDDEKEKKE